MLAQYNGFAKADLAPAGLTLNVPSLTITNTHNTDGMYATYMLDKIIGSFYPNMPMPNRSFPKPKKKGFLDVLVEAVVGAVVMVCAPELATFFTGFLGAGELIGSIVGYGVAGALSDLATQTTGIILGDQHGISFSEVAKSALIAGITGGLAKGFQAKGLSIDPAADAASGNIGAAIKDGAILATVTQALSLATGIISHANWQSIVIATAGAGLNAGMNGYVNANLKLGNFSNTAINQVDTLTNTVVDTELASLVMHNTFDAESTAATLIGTMIGNYIGSKFVNTQDEQQKQAEDRQKAQDQQLRAAEQKAEDDDFMQSLYGAYPGYKGGLSHFPLFGNRTVQSKTPSSTSGSKAGNDPTYDQSAQSVNSHLDAKNVEMDAQIDKMCLWNQSVSEQKDWSATSLDSLRYENLTTQEKFAFLSYGLY